MCLCVWVNKERENYITRERWEKFISAKGGSFPTTGLDNWMLFSDSSQSWPNQISRVDLTSKTLQNVSFKDAAALYLSCAPLNVFVPQCPLLMSCLPWWHHFMPTFGPCKEKQDLVPLIPTGFFFSFSMFQPFAREEREIKDELCCVWISSSIGVFYLFCHTTIKIF